MKIFCGDCKFIKYYANGTTCEHPNNFKDTWHWPKNELIQEPFDRNKNNDCYDFQSKKAEKS